MSQSSQIPSPPEQLSPPDVAIWHNRYFMALWIAQFLSQVAQNSINFAVLIVVERLTGSTTQVSLAVLSFIVPSILFGILAGVMVDRLDKKVVLVVTNTTRAVAVLGYFIFDQAVAGIYLVTFVFSTISQFFAPAEAAAIPLLVSRRQLVTANALFNLTFTASQLIGFVLLAPLVIKLFGPTAFFVVVAILYVVCALLVALLPPDPAGRSPFSPQEGEDMIRRTWHEVRDGWEILRGDAATFLAVIQLTVINTLILVMATIAPRFAAGVLRVAAEDAAYILAPAGVGVFAGSLAINRVLHHFPRHRVVEVGLISLGLGLMALAAVKTGGQFLYYNLLGRLVDVTAWPQVVRLIPMVMLITLVLGLDFAAINIPAQTTLQERCPASFRGRIFAVLFTISNVAAIVPLLFVGGIADLIGVNKTIFLVGATVIALGLYSVRVSERTETGPPPVSVA